MKRYGVHGIVTRSQNLGAAIRRMKEVADGTPEEEFFRFTGGHKLFRGKIGDVLREVRGGFNFGKVMLEGIYEYKGRQAYVEFQNENLTATVDGEILATTPDLICPGGHRDLHPRPHRRAEIRQAGAGGGPGVLPPVAHAGRAGPGGAPVLRGGYRLYPAGGAVQGGRADV